ncbi:3'-5' exonuclease [Anaerovorax sp. IOR16]|uniref:3'-5' exonuclease n=1 Tax=Anaerovorax sp. IOR16 TaxID=2773458 RepID=UPI0019D2910E|nr:3'-5' exonuclease [Anaerovorax sp. IOR16]
MHYIIFDLEFNQCLPSIHYSNAKPSQCPFEIIQIGAIKLDSNYNTVSTFSRYVKPTIYTEISPFITELTGITKEQLLPEAPFFKIFNSFIKFIGSKDYIFCVWGTADMKELFRNTSYHNLNLDFLSKRYLNLQPFVSMHLKRPANKLIKLEHAVESFNISKIYPFHNALYDAYYTAELFKKTYNPSMQTSIYEPNEVKSQLRQKRKVIDRERLFIQFEKMYAREITKEEQEMILLAYKMGKTNQFLK